MLNIYERESETLKIMTSWAVLSAPPAPPAREPPFSYYCRAELEYMNIHPPISVLATALQM